MSRRSRELARLGTRARADTARTFDSLRRHPEAPAAALAAYAVVRWREPLGVPRPLVACATAAWPAAVARGLPAGRLRSYATFLAHTASYFESFELPHDDQGAQRRRLRIRYPIAIDRALGRGLVPGSRLQALRRRPALRALLDRGFGIVYFGWAPQRHLVLLWLLWRHPRQFDRSAALVCAVFDVALVVQALAPTAPPWWSAKYGHLQDPLHRVTIDASRELPLVPIQNADEAIEANPWASMPSPHTATAAMVALVALEADRHVGALAAAYAATLAVGLVYLGEHYAIDVIAGLALTAAVHTAEPLVRAPAARVARAVAGG